MFVACCVYIIASLCYITCTILNHLNASGVTVSVIVEISDIDGLLHGMHVV